MDPLVPDVRAFVARAKPLASEALAVVVFNGLAFAVNLVGLKLIAQRLSDPELGVYGLVATIVLLAQQAVFGPIATASMRHHSVLATDTDSQRAIRAGLAAARRPTTMSAIALVLAGTVALTGSVDVAVALFSIAVFVGFRSHTSVYEANFRARRKRVAAGLYVVLSAILRWGCALAVIQVAGPRMSSVFVGLALGATGDFTAHYLYRRLHRLEGAPDNDQMRDDAANALLVRKYALAVAAVGVVIWFRFAIERWVVGGALGTDDVATYTVMYLVGFQTVTYAAALVIAFVGPILFQQSGDLTDAGALERAGVAGRLLSVGFVALAGLAALVIYPFGSAILGAFVEAPASDAAALSVLVLSAGLWSGGQVCALVAQNSLQPGELVVPTIGAAVVATVLGIVMTFAIGLIGAAVASAVSSLVYYGWTMLSVARLNEAKLHR